MCHIPKPSLPNHPNAVGGEIAVEPGDRLPLIPSRLMKGGFQIEATQKFSVGLNAVATSDVGFRGDEGNLAPSLDGYVIVNLRADYVFGDRLSLFLNIDNIFDADYETFGLFGRPGDVLGDEYSDPRFVSPGAPRAAWIGVRARL